MNACITIYDLLVDMFCYVNIVMMTITITNLSLIVVVFVYYYSPKRISMYIYTIYTYYIILYMNKFFTIVV